MSEIPFTTDDVCWCQPFDGPVHPECPMHGVPDGSCEHFADASKCWICTPNPDESVRAMEIPIPEDLRLMYNSKHTSTQSALLIERIAKAEQQIKTANASAEEFERKWYLATDQIESLEQQLQAQQKEIERLSAPVSDEECGKYGLLSYWDTPREQAVNVDKLLASRAALSKPTEAENPDRSRGSAVPGEARRKPL